MQELQGKCARNLSPLCVHNISFFIMSAPDVRHLVQEQSMEKEWADAWSQTKPCPDIGRNFSKWTPTRDSCSSLLEVLTIGWRSQECVKSDHDPKIASTISSVRQHGSQQKQMARSSKRPILTCHSRRASIVDIRYMGLIVVKARSW
jgi:hypothetical protein